MTEVWLLLLLLVRVKLVAQLVVLVVVLFKPAPTCFLSVYLHLNF